MKKLLSFLIFLLLNNSLNAGIKSDVTYLIDIFKKYINSNFYAPINSAQEKLKDGTDKDIQNSLQALLEVGRDLSRINLHDARENIGKNEKVVNCIAAALLEDKDTLDEEARQKLTTIYERTKD